MKRFGFTLIELLIVVAIIAILAAIAVPNFLEAQTRAKVTRAVADMRTIATGLETYKIDTNHYPFDFSDDVAFPYYLHKCLTTPINYISNGGRLQDLFSIQQSQANNAVRLRYRYRAFSETWLSQSRPGLPFSSLPGPTSPGIMRGREVFGDWFLESKGPEGQTGPLPAGFSDGRNLNDWLWQLYDATNGTVSKGDVVKGPKFNMGQGYNYQVSY